MKEFETVWSVRNNHLIRTLPSQYVFYLLCCFKDSCPHPLCSTDKSLYSMTWFPGGPPLTYFPLPIPDPLRPWGDGSCGHFLSPEESFLRSSELTPMCDPPSTIIRSALSKVNYKMESADEIESLAKKCMLSVEEVQWWINHITNVNKNKKEGAKKAAETRRKKKNAVTTRDNALVVYKCGICKEVYREQTEESETWIDCDKEGCDNWYHLLCLNYSIEEIPTFLFILNVAKELDFKSNLLKV